MAKREFATRYARYLMVRSLPAALAGRASLLPYRFRYRTFWADPQHITGKPGFQSGALSNREHEIELLTQMTVAFLVPGPWDLQPRPFSIHHVVRDLFVLGLEPRRTEAYREMAAGVQAGDEVRARGCKTIGEVDRRFEELISLYRSIENDGYRTQLQLGRPPIDEITVCIGRTGRMLLLRYGHHRLSIAKVLGLTRVPVRVRGVHPGWLTYLRRNFGESNVAVVLELGLRSLMGQSEECRVPSLKAKRSRPRTDDRW